jgi:putative ABC transport system ATP-binding protein
MDAGACDKDGVVCRAVEMQFTTPSGPLKVLDGVDFRAPAGELTMLVGPSGCGKTTLISIIAGILRGASGSVHVFGRDVTKVAKHALPQFRLANVGFVFQQYNLVSALDATENAAVPLVAAGVPWPDATTRARVMLDRLGLGAQVDKLPKQLSGGQQQRVAIARALVHDPRLLLCDEPTAALDGASGQSVMALLRELAVHPERAAIVVTHDPRVFEYADRIAHMEDGVVSRVVCRGHSRRTSTMAAWEEA